VTAAPTSAALIAAGPPPPYKPPVLIGVTDKPMRVVAAAVALFLVVALVGFVGPSIQAENPGARTSEIAFSDTALDGRDLYRSLGCVSCHTQMVRPVVADVGLGAVTLNDTNQVLGTRRFGPDLSDVGSRLSSSQIEAIIAGLDGHPVHNLSEEDMRSVVAYLFESRTGGA
jgi:mono/diheme cytochrome c family protein